MITDEFLQRLPKTDLHVHLDGSIRLSTLIELAEQYHVELPADTESGLREKVFKDSYGDLGEYLEGFAYTIAVMQTESALFRVAYELGIDSQAEGVRYLEVRFAPQLHIHQHLSCENVLRAVSDGLSKARDEFNARPAVRDGKEPPFEFGIIVCALRMFQHGFSEYYDQLLTVHAHSEPKWIYALASLEMARAAVQVRNEAGLPIVGFDLAGQEAGYPAVAHREAFAYAHKHFLKKTVHAGEAFGPESIFQAITELHADRIGHGTHLFDPEMIQDPDIADKEGFVEDLAQFIADRRITLEICLTSNLQTHPDLHDLSQHPYRKMAQEKLSVTFCTDNRTVSNTTVSQELRKAVNHLDLDPADLKNTIIYGFKRSFYPGTYLEKRRYVRRVIDYYTSIEREFGEPQAPTPR